MKSEEAVFTDFNFSFITFPRQVFVNIFDDKMQQFQRYKQTMCRFKKNGLAISSIVNPLLSALELPLQLSVHP